MTNKPTNSIHDRRNIKKSSDALSFRVTGLSAAYAEMTADSDREAEADEWLRGISWETPLGPVEDADRLPGAR